MIDCYTWTTDNGYKPRMMLEETGLPLGHNCPARSSGSEDETPLVSGWRSRWLE